MAIFAVLFLGVATGWVTTGPAGAAANRAAIVVETGTGVQTACVTFGSDSISGIEALELAGLNPTVRAFGGMGGAVCAIGGHGCPADATCLTCQGATYWY